jgi:hypothetical protein
MAGQPRPDQVADRIAIDDLLDAYAHAIDTRDWDLFRSLFVPGAVLDYGSEGGPRCEVDEAVKWLDRSLAPFSMLQHIVANRRVEIDGDRARVRAYVFSPLGVPNGEMGLTFILSGGTYDDQLRKTPDGWRFEQRLVKSAWFHSGLTGLAAPPNVAR